ncbi:dynein light chain Tctex-type protein 2B [Danio aesculapii]|uniref:dynein light chain Tctex-type protein 2B n=1 Tax=Danio aesculapii TaxID=1142201 RepID=UPI0024C0BBB1|nr:dynein light chain Tctex-type protein 2B [Danio aesculapii]
MSRSKIPDTDHFISNTDADTGGQHESGDEQAVPDNYELEHLRKFQPFLVREKCEELLREAFGGIKYDHDRCRSISENLRAKMLDLLKTLFDRYRFIVQIVTGGKAGQSVLTNFEAVWDTDFDDYFMITYKQQDLYAFVMIFAIY